MKSLKLVLPVLAIVGMLTLLAPVRATGPAPLTVTDCSNDNDLRAKVTQLQNNGGGFLNFGCGTAVIKLTNQLPEITADTVIDGAGNITISGESAVRLFSVDLNRKLHLKNIVLERGYGVKGVGGAIINNGYLTLENTTVQYNYTSYQGGAIWTMNQVEIINSTLAHNIGGEGGAIYADEAARGFTVKITNSRFLDNRAGNTNAGGAIYAAAGLDIQNSEFANNRAGRAGAIYAVSLYRSATISESNFHDNKTMGEYPQANGGALLVQNTSVSIQSSVLRNNIGQTGGAVYVASNGELTVKDSTLSDNEATHGGAIENYGGLTLTNVTLSGNHSTYGGGGLKNESGTASLTNVTISNNSAAYSSGGIYNSGPNAHLRLKNVALDIGLTGRNCAFDKAPDISDFNLSSDNSCGFGAGHDDVNLLLGPLADNGGPTQSHLPQAGSPVLDSGTSSDAPITDQRGVTRPQGAGVDIGSVEVQPAAPTCTGKPAKPTLLKPLNAKKVNNSGVKLDWDDTPCALKFKVIIKNGASTGTRFQQKGGLLNSEFTTNPLVKGRSYAWRVVAINSNGKTKSDWWTFMAK